MAWGRRRPEPAQQPGWDDPLWVPQPVEQWVTPEQVAARLRRRRSRWRALRHAAVLLLIITVVGGTGVWAAGAVLGRWELPISAPGGADPTAEGTAPATEGACEPAVVQPASADGTAVTVLNGTNRTGLAGRVADELELRGFVLVDVGNASRELEPARVRYPSTAEPAALAVAAHLQDEVLEPDDTVDVVTVVLGETFGGLAGEPEAAQTITEAQPSLVTCADGSAGTPVLQDGEAAPDASPDVPPEPSPGGDG